MDQQHPSTPVTEHPDTRAGGVGLPEAPGTPTQAVPSEGEWLAVSTAGFPEQQRGRPLEHLVKELVYNALDSVGGSGRIDLDIQPTGPRRATVRCTDDGPGAEDLSRLNMVFVTSKNGAPVPPRPACKTVGARLTTERFAYAGGRSSCSRRACACSPWPKASSRRSTRWASRSATRNGASRSTSTWASACR